MRMLRRTPSASIGVFLVVARLLCRCPSPILDLGAPRPRHLEEVLGGVLPPQVAPFTLYVSSM